MKSIFFLLRKRILQALAFIMIYLIFFRKATLTVVALILAAVFLPSVLSAQEGYPTSWDQPYHFVADDMKLEDALNLFGRNHHIGVVIDDDIAGQMMRGTTGTVTSFEYLENLSADFGLNWYFDGSILRIYPIGDTETRIIPLKTRYADEVLETLVELGVYQPRFPHMAGEHAQALRVTGPREYLDVVTRTVEAIELSRQVDVRVRRGGVVVDYQGLPPNGRLPPEEPAATGDEIVEETTDDAAES